MVIRRIDLHLKRNLEKKVYTLKITKMHKNGFQSHNNLKHAKTLGMISNR